MNLIHGSSSSSSKQVSGVMPHTLIHQRSTYGLLHLHSAVQLQPQFTPPVRPILAQLSEPRYSMAGNIHSIA